MDFSETFDFMPTSVDAFPPTPPPVGEVRSPSVASGHGFRVNSPLPVRRNEEVQRRQELRRRHAINAELHQLRAINPNAYEEDGLIVIPAQRMMNTRLPRPVPIRAAATAAVAAVAATPDEDPRIVNNNNGNPQPRRNQRRKTRRSSSSRRRTSRR